MRRVQERDGGDEGSGEITDQLPREGRTNVNEIQTEKQETKTQASSHLQQTCQPDSHTVLREMKAMMEQKVEITNLKQEIKDALASMTDKSDTIKSEFEALRRENEAQAVKLSLLEEEKSLVNMLKHDQEAQTDVLASMMDKSDTIQSEFEVLRRENEAQAVKLSVLEEQKSLVNMLNHDQEVKKVAFSASLLASGDGHTGPYNAEVILVYKHIITNIGSAYNSNTGVFTAPVRGVYQFQIYVGAHGHASHPSGAVLYKNGQKVLIAYSDHTTTFGSASNGVSLLLEVGDVVYVRLWQNSWVYDNHNRHSTFSGHLLFTM